MDFLEAKSRSVPGYMGRRATRGYLYNLDTGEKVSFRANPAEIQRVEAVDWALMSSPGSAGHDYQYTGGGKRTIKFTLVLEKLDGAPKDEGVLREIAQLEQFTYPRGNDSLMDSQFLGPPRVLFSFGSRFWEVVITRLKFDESIFNDQLQPLFVEVEVSMEVDLLYSDANESMAIQRRTWAGS